MLSFLLCLWGRVLYPQPLPGDPRVHHVDSPARDGAGVYVGIGRNEGLLPLVVEDVAEPLQLEGVGRVGVLQKAVHFVPHLLQLLFHPVGPLDPLGRFLGRRRRRRRRRRLLVQMLLLLVWQLFVEQLLLLQLLLSLFTLLLPPRPEVDAQVVGSKGGVGVDSPE